MTRSGYFQQPTICKDRVVFLCDDNLWAVNAKGGTARRLTNAGAACSTPKLSHDGKQLAFVSVDEGHPEVFVMPFEGGAPKRLSYLGSQVCRVLGWTEDNKKIIISSDARSAFFRHDELFELSLNGQELTPLNLGHANAFSRDSKNRAVLSRNAADPALWKRYKGGRAGEIWIDSEGKGQFRPLTKLSGNMVSAMWVKGRVYFLSDHEGLGNIYSCKPDGRDLAKHTNQHEYYARFPDTDGERIIYSAGGDLHILDCNTDTITNLKIEAAGQEAQSARKFTEAISYLEHYTVHPKGHSVGFISRGQAFSMPFFEGPCIQYGDSGEVRYRLFEWLPDGEHFIAVDDSNNFERIGKHSSNTPGEKPEYISNDDIGRLVSLELSPNGKFAAVSNHRYELLIVD